jgi:ankyrin repeat protein
MAVQAVHSAVATYARRGNLEAVKSLINSGNVGINDPINKAEDSILHAATSQNRFKVVEYLVGIGANVNAANQQGTTPLKVAVSSSRNPKLVRLLLDVGADPTRRHFQLRKTALNFAADAGYRAAEELLNEATNGEPVRTSDLQDDEHDRAKPRKPCCPFCGVKQD